MWRGGYLDRGRGLFGVELPRGGELLQTVPSDFGRHERARLAGARVHRLQYAALLLDRLPGSDHVDGFIEPLRGFRDDLDLFKIGRASGRARVSQSVYVPVAPVR